MISAIRAMSSLKHMVVKDFIVSDVVVSSVIYNSPLSSTEPSAIRHRVRRIGLDQESVITRTQLPVVFNVGVRVYVCMTSKTLIIRRIG